MNYDLDSEPLEVSPLDPVFERIDESEARVVDWLLKFAHRVSLLSSEIADSVSDVPEGELSELEQSARNQALAAAEDLDALYSDANLAIEDSSARFDGLRELCSGLEAACQEEDGSYSFAADLPGQAGSLLAQLFSGPQASAPAAQLEIPGHEEFASAFASGLDELASSLRRLVSGARVVLESFPATQEEHNLSLPALSDLCDSCPVASLDDA